MDVEGRFVWTPVSMVRMLQRYVITSRWGHKRVLHKHTPLHWR